MISIVAHASPEDELLAGHACSAVESALAELRPGEPFEVSVVLTDDDTLQRLNAGFRGIDRPTDVLSFVPAPMPGPSEASPNLGDIVISVPYAGRSAGTTGWNIEDEVRLLAVHGLLHLLGLEDETEEGAAEMHALEGRLGVRPVES